MSQPTAVRTPARWPALREVAVRTGVAFGVVIVVVALLAVLTHHPPAAAIQALLVGAFGNQFHWTNTLIQATPILLTGLSVAWAFRAGLFNIGAEGQLLWGAIAAAWACNAFHAPGPVLILLALIAGAGAGALWAAPAAYLKNKRGTPEVVSTLLLSWVALYFTNWLASGPLHDPTQQGPRTASIPEAARLLTLGGTRLHAGLILALLTAALLAVVLQRSRFGFQLQVVGKNPDAARSTGIWVPRITERALLQSGALAGLAGAVEILGVHHYFQSGFSPGYGYTGIAVAILGGNAPFGVVAAAVFLGGLANGAVSMSIDLHLSSEVGRSMVAVIQALVILAVAVRRWPAFRHLVARKPLPTTAEV